VFGLPAAPSGSTSAQGRVCGEGVDARRAYIGGPHISALMENVPQRVGEDVGACQRCCQKSCNQALEADPQWLDRTQEVAGSSPASSTAAANPASLRETMTIRVGSA
jgi:hypothetical protein